MADRRSSPKIHSTAVLLGFSPETVRACVERDWPAIAVVPPGLEDKLPGEIPTLAWNFDQPLDDLTVKPLVEAIREEGGGFCVPLFEETVGWAGAVDAQLMDDRVEYRRVRLFLNKAVMKHRAQMRGLRIGACEEALDIYDLKNFWRRVQQAALKGRADEPEPIHIKALKGGGAVGHRMIRTEREIARLPITTFPCVVESHLRGQEFSCEAFVSGGELVFLNITEYAKLGHVHIVPPGPKLAARKDEIWTEVQRLIDAFDIERGLYHPEYFLDVDGHLAFGEVAARVPGGFIFNMIEDAYGFDPFAATVLARDPEAGPDALRELIGEAKDPDVHEAVVITYPKDPHGRLGHLYIPPEIEHHELLVEHTLFDPIIDRLPPGDGFWGQLGALFLRGEDYEEIRAVASEWDEVDFFPPEAGRPSGPRLMPSPETENPPPSV